MPAVHRLSAELYEEDFELIALHSRLEDYALAYALNLYLKTGFGRRRKDLDISGQVTIPIFEWKDDSNERYWTFFANYGIMEDESLKDGLFKDEPFYRGFHLVPEYRETDYFLKIEQESPDSVREVENQNLVKALQRIPKVTMAYSVNTDRLKSKNNLIF
ncbi:MAG TPA: IPExxxVDY family protein [Pricia sp.]|nr:IPExxxVDY family protein [Pricia sp.]